MVRNTWSFLLRFSFSHCFSVEMFYKSLVFILTWYKKYLSLLHFFKKKNKQTKKEVDFLLRKKKSSDIQYVEVLHCYCKLSSSVIATDYQSIKMRTVLLLLSWIILLNWKHRYHSRFVDLNYQMLALCVCYVFLTYKL